MRVTIHHWLPILTFCPVNHLPDLIYASVTFDDDKTHELYAVRRAMRGMIKHRKQFMESLAQDLSVAFPDAVQVRISLAFNRHVVIINKESK